MTSGVNVTGHASTQGHDHACRTEGSERVTSFPRLDLPAPRRRLAREWPGQGDDNHATPVHHPSPLVRGKPEGAAADLRYGSGDFPVTDPRGRTSSRIGPQDLANQPLDRAFAHTDREAV